MSNHDYYGVIAESIAQAIRREYNQRHRTFVGDGKVHPDHDYDHCDCHQYY